MLRRKALVATVGSITLLGVMGMATILTGSLNPSERAKTEAWKVYELSLMAPGALEKFGAVWVYRRTAADRARAAEYEPYLDDPDSLRSVQPTSAKNRWRSGSEEFFIFNPAARFQDVRLRQPGAETWATPEEIKFVTVSPHFFEPYDGRIFDLSGRVFRRVNNPIFENLRVPQTQWLTPTKVMVWNPVGDGT